MTGPRHIQPSAIAALHKTKGVLLDLDGTLVLSEDAHRQSWHAVFDAWGMSVADSEYEQYYMGRRPADALGSMPGPWAAADIEHIIAAMTGFLLDRADTIPAVSGAADLIRRLHGQGVPVAVVTSAGTVWAQRLLEDVLKVRSLVDVVVTSEQVTHGKPSPEGYLAACRALGVSPQQCMAFEDSLAGLRALTAAGVRDIIGVTTTGTAASLVRAGARWTSPDLAYESIRTAAAAYDGPSALFRNDQEGTGP
ncbi:MULTISPECIES: HAD family hydrolase [Streptomyces]|uniref:HAD family hydrolase n=1 Tax=Streptomyces herbicida TaxID=3065675 RepID=UPI00293130E8|nr:HAD family phosphatase [Streptomyces sp. NEAU-HV9]